jgi:hypothetical protein
MAFFSGKRNPAMGQALMRAGAGLLGSAPTVGDRFSQGLLGFQQGMQSGLKQEQMMEERRRREQIAQQIRDRNRQQVPGTTQYLPSAPQGVPHQEATFETGQGQQRIGSGVTGAMTTEGPPTMRGLLASEAARSGDYAGAAGLLSGGGQAGNIGKIDPSAYTPQSVAQFQQTGDFSVLEPTQTGQGVGKINPRYYTPASIAEYQKTGDYSTLERYQPGEIPGTEEYYQRQKRQREAESKKEQERRAERLATEAFNIAGELLTPEEQGGLRGGLESATGPLGQFVGGLGGQGANARAKLERLSALLTKENLSLMSGVLSESDIKILQRVGASLERGQTDEAMLDEVERLYTKFARQTNNWDQVNWDLVTRNTIMRLSEEDIDQMPKSAQRKLEKRMDDLGM